MAFLILALALLLGIAGGALLLYDGKQRAPSTPASTADADTASAEPASADQASAAPAPAEPAPAAPVDSGSADAESADAQAEALPVDAPHETAGPAGDAPNLDSGPTPNSAPSSEPTPEPDPKPEPVREPEPDKDSESESSAESTPEQALIHDLAHESDRQPASDPESEPRPHSKPHARHRPVLPGTIRRERRNWAEAKGFEFMKSDPYLVDEWTRGVASTGAAPKDIVAGNVYGHEMLLMDIDGVNVMAMRTGAASDMVVDFRRFDRESTRTSEDLLLAMTIEGFDVYSSESAVTERMVDERVHVALQQMPESVTALWMETEWVLAQTTKQARSAEWDAMLPPLALLADAARVLPPRSSATQVLRLEDLDPVREIPAQPIVEAVGGAPAAGVPEFERPVIQRPEEPLQMPSRAYSETRGPVEHTALGGDEVDAIADGRERPNPDSHTARLPRQQFRAASIFDSPAGDSTSSADPDAADSAAAHSDATDSDAASDSSAEESDSRRGE
ncbi:hypothetical protein L8V01_09490 [Corynebacterium sp. c8Ua_181]|uniref:Uncharacterized protein n=1 Tax=Corynebacterium curieae TaxID=2913500 RepID=A0A9X3MBA1_9CORY|nr:hypothetical protein [Corynebacterium curieae]MCZ9307707.1 hypothetical protein [Corynebacterium curieae]MDV2424910.1 hypothetical protein [Corynebacterium curieae]